MHFNKSDLITAILASVVGAIGGIVLYFPDIQNNAFPNSDTVEWTTGAIDEQVLKDTANIKQLLALEPPRPGAPDDEWKRFILELDQVEMGKRYSNSGVTTPLLGWYAYIAKHHPTSIYNLLENNRKSYSLFNHLLQFGLLKDWADNMKNRDQILLRSTEALLSFSISRGEKKAQRDLADAFFNSAENKNNNDGEYKLKPININLKNILFSMNAMTETEKKKVLPLLQSGLFKFDPRAVEHLTHLENMDSEGLLSLIKMYAYPSKSMSSYMTTGALLGEKKYVASMVEDVHDNAKQPTNFYCSACGLALATDGLIGQTLINVAAEDKLQINKSISGEFILSKTKNGHSSSWRVK